MIVPCLVVTGRGVYRGEVDLAQVQFLWFDGLRRWVNLTQENPQFSKLFPVKQLRRFVMPL